MCNDGHRSLNGEIAHLTEVTQERNALTAEALNDIEVNNADVPWQQVSATDNVNDNDDVKKDEELSSESPTAADEEDKQKEEHRQRDESGADPSEWEQDSEPVAQVEDGIDLGVVGDGEGGFRHTADGTECKPCFFFWTPVGCKGGKSCQFCHVDHPGLNLQEQLSKSKRERFRRLVRCQEEVASGRPIPAHVQSRPYKQAHLPTKLEKSQWDPPRAATTFRRRAAPMPVLPAHKAFSSASSAGAGVPYGGEGFQEASMAPASSRLAMLRQQGAAIAASIPPSEGGYPCGPPTNLPFLNRHQNVERAAPHGPPPQSRFGDSTREQALGAAKTRAQNPPRSERAPGLTRSMQDEDWRRKDSYSPSSSAAASAAAFAIVDVALASGLVQVPSAGDGTPPESTPASEASFTAAGDIDSAQVYSF